MKGIGKGIISCMAALLLLIGTMPTVYGQEDALPLESKSAVLMDVGTGTVLYEKNSHEAMPPASVTKIMTLLLIYEAQENGQFGWEDSVQVSEHAASMGGSQVFLEPGEMQTAADLTKCIAIASANDAAVAMAEFVAGSEEAFVERMKRFVHDKCCSYWRDLNPQLDRRKYDSFNAFIINGCVGILAEWLDSDMEEAPEEIADTAAKIVSSSIRAYIVP